MKSPRFLVDHLIGFVWRAVLCLLALFASEIAFIMLLTGKTSPLRWWVLACTDFKSYALYSVLLMCSIIHLRTALPATWWSFKRLQLGTAAATYTSHGSTLREVACGIRNERCEYLALFTASGAKLSEWTSLHPSEVTNRMEGMHKARCLTGCVWIHNHPGITSAFSPDDIYNAIWLRASRSIVVSKDVVYEIEMTDNAWNLDLSEIKKDCAKRLRALTKFCFTEKQLIQPMIKFNEEMAEKYGYTFRYQRFEDSVYAKNVETER